MFRLFLQKSLEQQMVGKLKKLIFRAALSFICPPFDVQNFFAKRIRTTNGGQTEETDFSERHFPSFAHHLMFRTFLQKSLEQQMVGKLKKLIFQNGIFLHLPTI